MREEGSQGRSCLGSTTKLNYLVPLFCWDYYESMRRAWFAIAAGKQSKQIHGNNFRGLGVSVLRVLLLGIELLAAWGSEMGMYVYKAVDFLCNSLERRRD